eukprot:1216786-Amphidinium_carterae.2
MNTERCSLSVKAAKSWSGRDACEMQFYVSSSISSRRHRREQHLFKVGELLLGYQDSVDPPNRNKLVAMSRCAPNLKVLVDKKKT